MSRGLVILDDGQGLAVGGFGLVEARARVADANPVHGEAAPAPARQGGKVAVQVRQHGPSSQGKVGFGS